MANINLAPGTKYLALVRKRRLRIFMLSGFLGLAMFLIWGGLFLVNNDLRAQKKTVQDQLAGVEVEITRLGASGQRVISFQNRLEAVDHLLTQHISWDPVLNELERLLPVSTTLTSITADTANGSISVDGFTTDIDNVAQTLASLNSSAERDTAFTQGTFGGITQENVGEGDEASTRVKFQASFELNKDIFK